MRPYYESSDYCKKMIPEIELIEIALERPEQSEGYLRQALNELYARAIALGAARHDEIVRSHDYY